MEENPLKMIKLKKVPPPEKKSSMDTKVKQDNLDGPRLSDYVFQTASDDLDREITPNQRRFGDVASEALALSKHTASKIPESEPIPIEETPLKMVKLKKVTPPEKKLSVDTKRKKFELPQLRSTKANPKDLGDLPGTTPSKSEQDRTESKHSAFGTSSTIENQVTSLNKDSIQKDLTSTKAEKNEDKDKPKIHEENIVEENKVELRSNKDSSLIAMEVEIVSSPQVQTAVSVSFTPVTMEMLDPPTVTNISESDEGIDSASDSVGEFLSVSEGDDIVYEEPLQEPLHGPEEYSRLGTRRISFNFSKNVVHNISQDESDDDDDEDESDYEEEKDEEKQEEKQEEENQEEEEKQEDQELEEELNVSPSLLNVFQIEQLRDKISHRTEETQDETQVDGLGSDNSDDGDTIDGDTETVNSADLVERSIEQNSETKENPPESHDGSLSQFQMMRAEFIEQQKEASNRNPIMAGSNLPNMKGSLSSPVKPPRSDAHRDYLSSQRSSNDIDESSQLSDTTSSDSDNYPAPNTTLETSLGGSDLPHGSQVCD